LFVNHFFNVKINLTFFSGDRGNLSHSLLKVGSGQPYLRSAGKALQAKIHPGAHDLEGFATAGMGLLQFKNITNIDFQSHCITPSATGSVPMGSKAAKGSDPVAAFEPMGTDPAVY